MKNVTCGHRIPSPVSGKYNRKNGPFRFPDGHKVPSKLEASDKITGEDFVEMMIGP